jgi:hypothetical protein
VEGRTVKIGVRRGAGSTVIRSVWWCALAGIASIGLGACGGSSSFNPLPGPIITQALWVANGTNVLEFTPAQTTTFFQSVIGPPPQRTMNIPAFGAPRGVTFDANGNLWVENGGTMIAGGNVPSELDFFTAAQLANLKTVSSPTPTVVLRAGFVFIQQAVFDKAGDLWVTDTRANVVDEFTPAQLAVGGPAVVPNIQLKSTPAFTGPLGIAFGANGNLWIANVGGTTLFEFNASALAVTGPVTLVPNVILSDNGAKSIQAPWALAFDSAGNLWSSNASPAVSTVVEFAKASLAASGNPTPAVTISPSAGPFQSLVAPFGIAFDSLGDLAAVNSQVNSNGLFSIGLFQPVQLATNNQPAAAVIAGSTLSAPAGDVFGPTVP